MKIKVLFVFGLSLLLFTAYSQQSPIGMLWMHHGNEGFSQVSYIGGVNYPDMQYQYVDSGIINSFCANDSALFYGAQDLLAYYIPSASYVTLGTELYMSGVTCDDSTVAVSSYQNPYIRIYKPQSAFENLTAFDTTFIHEPVADMLIVGTKLFLLQTYQVQIIDLELMDTIATVETPQPFPFGGMNSFIVEGAEELYIVLVYATGAERYSVTSLNKNTFDTATVYHQEFSGVYDHPVIAGDDMYLGQFPTYYSFTDDSLYLQPYQVEFPRVKAYDAVSNNLFVSEYSSGYLYLHNPTMNLTFDTVQLAGPIWTAQFKENQIQRVEFEEPHRFGIYPNPATSNFTIQTSNAANVVSVKMQNLQGQEFRSEFSQVHADALGVQTSGLAAGIYLVLVQFANGEIGSQKLMLVD